MPDLKPRVSVIIPSYQNAKELPRAVISVLNQDYSNFEIVIIDNASTDGTPKICSTFAASEPRIKWKTLVQNLGPAGARNEGVKIARGEFIAFLDADDEWLNGKLATQVEILDSFPAIALVFCDGYLFDEKSNKKSLISKINKIQKKNVEFTPIDTKRPIYRLDGDVRTAIFRGNFINLSSVMLRKEAFDLLGGFDQSCYGMEDLDFWVRLARKSKFAYLFERVIICYWRSLSLSRMTEKRISELLEYYFRCYSSTEFSDLKSATQANLYYCYKLLILHYSDRWRPIRALNAFRESLQVQFYPSLFMYSLLSFLGNIPLRIKNEIINPFFERLQS